MLQSLLIAALVALLLWALGLVVLYAAGKRGAARALATFLPDSLVLVQRLLREPTLGRSRKLALWALLAYLAMPLDLVPDFLPVIGALDDAILAALTLRFVLRGASSSRVAELWPGSAEGLAMIYRLAATGPESSHNRADGAGLPRPSPTTNQGPGGRAGRGHRNTV